MDNDTSFFISSGFDSEWEYDESSTSPPPTPGRNISAESSPADHSKKDFKRCLDLDLAEIRCSILPLKIMRLDEDRSASDRRPVQESTEKYSREQRTDSKQPLEKSASRKRNRKSADDKKDHQSSKRNRQLDNSEMKPRSDGHMRTTTTKDKPRYSDHKTIAVDCRPEGPKKMISSELQHRQCINQRPEVRKPRQGAKKAVSKENRRPDIVHKTTIPMGNRPEVLPKKKTIPTPEEIFINDSLKLKIAAWPKIPKIKRQPIDDRENQNRKNKGILRNINLFTPEMLSPLYDLPGY